MLGLNVKASSLLGVCALVFAIQVSVSPPTRGEAAIKLVLTVPHVGDVSVVDFAPDGMRVVSGGSDHTIKIWDVASGRILRTLQGHSDRITSVRFSPDGHRLVSGSDDQTVRLWDALSGKLLRTLQGHAGQVKAVAFSPDGARIASGGGGDRRGDPFGQDYKLRVWDAGAGTLLRTLQGHSREINSIAFSPDGNSVISGSGDKTLKLWDATSGRLLRSVPAGNGGVTSVVFSSDGSRVLSGGYERPVKLWDVGTWRVVQLFEGYGDSKFSQWVNSVALSSSGDRVLVTSSEHVAKLWDAKTGAMVHRLEGHSEDVLSGAFSPDGKRIITASRDSTLKLWDADSGKLLRTFGGGFSALNAIDVSPDAKHLVSTSGKKIHLWDVQSGALLRSLEGHSEVVNSVVFSPDGAQLLSGAEDRTAKLWDVQAGRQLITLSGHSDGLAVVKFAPRGGRLVSSGQNDRTIRIWDAITGRQLRSFTKHPGTASDFALSPDGSRIVIPSLALTVWDVATGRSVRQLAPFDKTSKISPDDRVAISPDGRWLASGGEAKEVRIWDLEGGKLVRTLRGHKDWVTSLTFTPDGARILSASRDAELKLWEVQSGQPLRTFANGAAEAWAPVAAFSPDGSRMYSRSGSAIKVWNVDTGELLATMMATGGEWLVITPEGFFFSSENGANILSVVRGLEGWSIDQFFQALYRPDLVREKLAGDPKGLVRAAAAKLDLDKILAGGAAPQVRLLAPTRGASIRTDQATAEAEISDAGGGIGRVEWRVNGVTLGIETRGLVRADRPAAPAAGTVTVRQALALDPGDNVIEVVAYNAQGLIASLPASVKVTREGAAPSAAVRLHVLAVGINDYYDGRLRLNYAVPDAKALGAAFSKAGATVYEQVHVTTVLDADVTRAKLDAVFNELAGNVRPGDVFVFFIAGHGKTVDGRYYFIPQDFRYETERSIVEKGIDQEQWQVWFARIAAKKSVLLFDTCESGSLTGEQVALRGLEHVAALERMTRAMGRTILSASTDDAPALEGYRGHGLFTFTLLEGIERADADGNGLIEVTELAQYVDAQVPELSLKQFKRRQVPQMRIVGSNYALAKPTAVLAAGTSEPAIARRPTHVVLTATEVLSSPAPGAARVQTMAPGTAVVVVRTEAGWTLVVREGRPLGFVATKDLVPIQ